MIGYVYAIGASDCVKIGYSTDPLRRLVKLQSDNAMQCTLLGAVRGTEVDEAALHEMLKPYLISGEWYRRGSQPVEHLIELMPAYASEKDAERQKFCECFRIFDKLGGQETALDIIAAARAGWKSARPSGHAVKYWRHRRQLPGDVTKILWEACAARGIECSPEDFRLTRPDNRSAA